jgi:predicted ribosomally synthesized peptide with nif11-like leader
MSEQQLTALLALVESDPDLKAQFIAASSLGEAQIIASRAGFEVEVSDWCQHLESDRQDLSDLELEGVAGGLINKGPKPSIYGKTIEIKAEEIQIIC